MSGSVDSKALKPLSWHLELTEIATLRLLRLLYAKRWPRRVSSEGSPVDGRIGSPLPEAITFTKEPVASGGLQKERCVLPESESKRVSGRVVPIGLSCMTIQFTGRLTTLLS